jgi:heme exporter protein B
MLLFSLTSAFLFSASIPHTILKDLFAPLLLLIFLFVGVLGYSISFLKEFDSETIEGLKSSPLKPQDIIAGKIIFNLILMLAVQSVVVPICFALFDVSGNFILAFLVFSVCNASLAVSISAIAPLVSHSKARELLMPVMLFPLVYPIISSTISAVNSALLGVVEFGAVAFVAAYTGIIISVAMLVADYVFY